MATTSISLIRPHTEQMKPPRALWVSFELGRPLGSPGDAAFQKRVMMAALELLLAEKGPVLVDYLEDAPRSDAVIEGWSCAVDFSSPAECNPKNDFIAEFNRLRPWYDEGLKKRGRTTAMASGMDPDRLAAFIAAFCDGAPENPRPELPLAAVLNHAVMDLKAYYIEAVTSRPGQERPESDVLADWFWQNTCAGALLYSIKNTLRNGPDPLLKLVGIAMIVPASHSKKEK